MKTDLMGFDTLDPKYQVNTDLTLEDFGDSLRTTLLDAGKEFTVFKQAAVRYKKGQVPPDHYYRYLVRTIGREKARELHPLLCAKLEKDAPEKAMHLREVDVELCEMQVQATRTFHDADFSAREDDLKPQFMPPGHLTAKGNVSPIGELSGDEIIQRTIRRTLLAWMIPCMIIFYAANWYMRAVLFPDGSPADEIMEGIKFGKYEKKHYMGSFVSGKPLRDEMFREMAAQEAREAAIARGEDPNSIPVDWQGFATPEAGHLEQDGGKWSQLKSVPLPDSRRMYTYK